MMEAERLTWIRRNQSKLRVGKYRQLNETPTSSNQSNETLKGKRVVFVTPQFPVLKISLIKSHKSEYFSECHISSLKTT